MLSLSWGMKLIERPVIPRLPFVLLALWVLLLVPSQCFQGHPTWRYISSEVVIPRKEIYHGKGFQPPGRLSYSLRFRGRTHIIHLRRKTLIWPRHLLLTTQDDQGALQMDYPFFPADCYYIGYLEGIPQSTVTLDTCYDGLDGVIMFYGLAYEIKPFNNSHRFEHFISQIVTDSETVGPVNEWKHMDHNIAPLFSETNAKGRPRMSSRDYASHPGAIKGHFQASHNILTEKGTVENTCKFLFWIVSIIDNFFISIHIRYYVFLLTVHTQPNLYREESKVPGGNVHNFFISNFYNIFRPDASTLISVNFPNDRYSYPVLGSLCTANCLTLSGEHNRHHLILAILTTNRLARCIGIDYDDETYCFCQRRPTCIMYKSVFLTDAFSNCSLSELGHILNTPNAVPCLFYDHHTYYNTSYTYDICGNFKINTGEQCDCGSYKSCYANSCCQSDCRFTAGSICDKESCCVNCTYSPAGTLCRSIQNICDLPEYCSGVNFECPIDFYLQDGTPCSEEGYCYEGNCTDRSMHCKEIFGAGALEANKICYNINKQNNRFGHCQRTQENLQFTACTEKNKFCGRLQCTNVTKIPHLQEHVSFHQSVIAGFSCFGLDEHRSTETTDTGHVRRGSPCSKEKFCDRGSCNGTFITLNYDCTPEKCNFRGVCNNLRNCHCHVGFNPPKCLEEGPGGSIDSGPLPFKMRTIRQSQQPVVYLRVVFARIYVFLGSLLFGVAYRVAMTKIIKYEDLQAALKGHAHGGAAPK
ncbi:disintegrin and metalloproteinase domain-containing protein 21-like [Sigmodon hispidus]